MLQPQQPHWPPTYNLRYSQRARQVNLKISPINGLEVIVPKKFNLKNIPEIIEQHRPWIERTQQRFKNITSHQTAESLPKIINLAALNQIWHIDYQASAASVLYLKTSENKLTISGCLQNESRVRKLLHKWLKRLAKNYLIPKLKELSERHNLPFAKANIRHSQTHWGSCTAKKNISLSSQLLFITPELVNHVLLHELCHTKVLNHSKNFWHLLESVNSDCHNLRKQLRAIQYDLPQWITEK